MGLSCGCDTDWYPEAGDVVVIDIRHEQTMPFIRARKKCTACKELINAGEIVNRILRARIASNEVEEKIYGEGAEIPIASHYMCEKCSDLCSSLTEIGYCESPYDNQYELLALHNKFKRSGNESSNTDN